MNKEVTKRALPSIKGMLAGAGLALVLVGSFAGTAHAYDHDHRGGRDWHHHHWHGRPYGQPGYVYAPPVVYAPPQPVASSGLNLVLPLNFR